MNYAKYQTNCRQLFTVLEPLAKLVVYNHCPWWVAC